MTSLITKEESFVPVDSIVKETNAVYIAENPQDALEKLKNLSTNNDNKEKIQYIKHLAELISVIGNDAFECLNDIISPIEQGNSESKRAFLTQIAPLLSLFQARGEQGYKVIITVIVPILSRLIYSINYNVKEEAGQGMAMVAPILTEEDRGKYLLTTVLGLAHDEDIENNRIVAVRLLSEMAPLFGRDLCDQFVGFEFLSMGEETNLRVRKEAAMNLPSIAKIVSPDYFHKRLLPYFVKLSKDQSWQIRKVCVDMIYEISLICSNELASLREKELTTALVAFLKDSNKWVKISAYKMLGPFISTLEGLKIQDKLIDGYLMMANPEVNNLALDNEIIEACSYNFPAVVLTLGKAKWSKLSKLFRSLVKSDQKVRRPIACALHEIAKIIGEEHTEKDLLPAFETFIKDKNDDIKFGVIRNLALFLKVFHIRKRENMIDLFLQLQKDQNKWRIRELIANQIDKLTIIYKPDTTFTIIASITFKLCRDPVASVRDQAARKIYSIIKVLSNSEPTYKNVIIKQIIGFSQSKKFSNRQSFIIMCEKIMKDADMFMKYFFDHFALLAGDKVGNVRVTVAKTLLKVFKKDKAICKNPAILELIAKMRKDANRDVRAIIEDLIKANNIQIEEKTPPDQGETEEASGVSMQTNDPNTVDTSVEQKIETQEIPTIDDQEREGDLDETNVNAQAPQSGPPSQEILSSDS